MARLHDQYREKVVPELVQKFGYKSCDGGASHHEDHAEYGCRRRG